MIYLLQDVLIDKAMQQPLAPALLDAQGNALLSYAELMQKVTGVADYLYANGVKKGDRVAIYIEKRVEFVVTVWAAAMVGAVFVPINPLLKAEQVQHIVQDCAASLFVTSYPRWQSLTTVLGESDGLSILLLDEISNDEHNFSYRKISFLSWRAAYAAANQSKLSSGSRFISQTEQDLVAIFYTSGSTGKPKGVMLSHRNLLAGAQSVATYLQNQSSDRLLAALPFSFDAGFSQLTTAFWSGASVALLNYLFPKDVLQSLQQAQITGLTAVPPLWIQLSGLRWPVPEALKLRYWANTGGKMPRPVLMRLREHLPNSQIFLMYGLTEAFRATYLPPEQVLIRPDSIGKAIPNAEVRVLRPDGTPCQPHEIGELVQLGPHVAMGYWQAPDLTAERFKPVLSPDTLDWQAKGLATPPIGVFSGDKARYDEEGYLYFEGRADDMIKTSGYRVSPTELEELAYAIEGVDEVAAIGVPHPQLGQSIALVVYAPALDLATLNERLRDGYKKAVAAFMQPQHIEYMKQALPRNPNGKIDRPLLLKQLLASMESVNQQKSSMPTLLKDGLS